jgi:hypothetical protein
MIISEDLSVSLESYIDLSISDESSLTASSLVFLARKEKLNDVSSNLS